MRVGNQKDTVTLQAVTFNRRTLLYGTLATGISMMSHGEITAQTKQVVRVPSVPQVTKNTVCADEPQKHVFALA